MPNFALIAEGVTDQIVLETIIQSYYSASLDDEIDFRELQPLRDETDKARQGNFGGWEGILEYCACADKILEALSFNDYLVIQIDTDCGDHVNYGLSLTSGGKDRPTAELINDAIAKLHDTLTSAVFDLNQDKFIFAIAVHSIECWLIPLYEADAKKKKRIKSCEDHLSKALQQKIKKTYRTYEGLVSPYKKPQTLEANRKYNESLHFFLSTLPELK